MERRIRDATRRREKNLVSPTVMFHFLPGQLVIRRHRLFSKLDPRTTGPFRIRSVTGTYRQRVLLEPINDPSGRKKRLTAHASQLVPFDKPYIEPEDLDFGPDPVSEALPDDPPPPATSPQPRPSEGPGD